MAKKKSVEELYNGIFSIRESLQDIVQLASDVVTMSQTFGGEIPRVLTEQLNQYFIPAITKFIDDESTPGAMTPLVTFLDSVPLAMTREEPQPQQLPPTPVPSSANLAEPPTDPAEGSYAAQVQESLGRNASGWEKHPSEVDADTDDYEDEWEKHPDELSYEDDDFEAYAMDEKKTRKSTAAAATVKEAVYHVGQTGKPPRPQSVASAGKKDSVVTVGIGRWDNNDWGESLYDQIVNQANKAGAWFDVEDVELDLDSESVLPQEEQVTFTIHFNNEAKAARFTKWAKSLALDGDINVMMESTLRETREQENPQGDMFAVYRKNSGGSTIGKQENMEDALVAQCACEDEANKKAEALNATLTPSEKEFFKTEYYVKKLETSSAEAPEGASKKVKESVDAPTEEAPQEDAEDGEEPFREYKLSFSDGVNFETWGPLRLTRRSDGYYVVGEGTLTPVDDPEEGYELINSLKSNKDQK